MIQGHYAKKQIYCNNKIIAWSHSSRFITTQSLLEKYASGNSKLLDYGCGDGTLIALVKDAFTKIIGTDISVTQIRDCQKRFYGMSQANFCLNSELNSSLYNASFDAAVCLEVLEHCLPSTAEQVIDDLIRLVKPNGLIIISVPVEIGLSLPIKQTTRRIAGLLHQGDYDKSIEPYSIQELFKMIFANRWTTIERPIYGDDLPYHGHKGFNWRSLRYELKKKLQIERVIFSPLGWLGGFVSSQVFLICRNS